MYLDRIWDINILFVDYYRFDGGSLEVGWLF